MEDFDAPADKKVLVYMNFGAGWVTGSGVKFSKDHPYQLVPASEVPQLLAQDRFRKAKPQDVKDYYQLGTRPEDVIELVNGDLVEDEDDDE